VGKKFISVARIVLCISLVGLFACLLAACPAGPTYIVQQYKGAPRAQETIAVLRVNGKDPIRLETLDDEEITARVADDARLHVELLPGRHTLSVRGGEPGKRISFQAEAGKVYRVAIEEAAPHVHEVDRDSDSLGRDVTTTTE
jgi:hypothetical protein